MQKMSTQNDIMGLEVEIKMFEMLNKVEDRYHTFLLKYADNMEDEEKFEIYDKIRDNYLSMIMDAYEICAKAYYDGLINKEIFINIHGNTLSNYVGVIKKQKVEIDFCRYPYIKMFLKETFEKGK